MNAPSPGENAKARAAHKDSKLTGLEAGRGVAAMLVLLRHSWGHCHLAYGDFWLGKIFAMGHVGVDFFFVLSGFIIFHAHSGDIGQPKQLGRYVERRTTRIYPIYWVALAAMIGSIKLAGHDWPSPQYILTSIVLWPTASEPLLRVGWTLQQEMMFYTLFAAIIVNRTLGRVLFAAWLALLVYVNAFGVEFSSGFLSKLSLFFNFEFFLGMFAAWYTARLKVPAPKLVLLAGILIFAVIGYGEDIGHINNLNIWTHIGYGAAAMITVFGLVGWERAGNFKAPRMLTALGGASYSIYLTHVLFIGLLWQVAVHLGLDRKLTATEAYVLIVAVAAVGGLATSIYVEKPLMALTRRWLHAVAPPRLSKAAL